GIGKTSLVRAVAAEATMSGCQVYWATCDELSQAFPLVPLLEALAAGLHSAGEAPGLDGINVAVEHILSAVDEACAAAPTMLVVDDIQWGDPATVQTVGRLARSVHQIP